ncbi:uncharacterized protein LOC111393767 isoform X2 [Olea europaea var. sylvestris]|uniref:Uncharacterized protein n=1 Tax=Olea europaea subsp. europaea TaxID=158383 RepID=A0A8S0TGD4_OLEEU|nr:uncharacterized protein LOC111393767 isoform X2 [Olea europaea var. sylvestris]CAA2965078.1 Hypothetical predicted protein [Olea europaea subsp. europaea]CAA3004605.1 Hypothetical predicted protein [Olea europaea subsp. europaea]
MDEFYFRRSHVPAFGSWDCNAGLPFTQCFESTRQAGVFRNSYSDEDRDLYVAGDLYENDIVTPAMIVVPRSRAKVGYPREKEGRKEEAAWMMCDYDSDMKSPVTAAPPPRPPPKAVDEDLYKISPELLRAQTKRKKARGFFSSCLRPSRVC